LFRLTAIGHGSQHSVRVVEKKQAGRTVLLSEARKADSGRGISADKGQSASFPLEE